MDNARVVVIVGMLLAVLLSAFAAERLRVCHGERRCLVETMPGLLPAARFFMARAANRPDTREPPVAAEVLPLPTPPAPDAKSAVVPGMRREADAVPRPAP